MIELSAGLWPAILTAAQFVLAAFASGHVILHKRDVRAAIGWVGLIWLVPIAGSTFYLLFGINRIRRRAADLRGPRSAIRLDDAHLAADGPPSTTTLGSILPGHSRHLVGIGALLDRIGDTPLTRGNRIEPLTSGEEAYRAMLAAIDGASQSIGLLTYIFDNDPAGHDFIRALAAAHQRGVTVRVLVDGVGARYSHPPASRLLADLGVPVAHFLPTRFPFFLPYANLRNHRKILIADGAIGFTGGMNIRSGHLARASADAISDLHFRLDGPVVDHLVTAFLEDWAFATGESLSDAWFQSPRQPPGGVSARGIAAGPDESFERIRWTILAALAVATHRVRILTPYFIPDQTLMTALSLAAMRGIDVDILIPERGNLRLVQWASRAKLSQLLIRGCRIWLTRPPFEHAKLMTVDEAWALIGSANWDQRSLRLNFEFNVECYGSAVTATLDALIEQRLATAKPYTLIDAEKRPLALRLRDGAAWLASPYL